MKLAVLESRWNPTGNHTIRPIFNILQDDGKRNRTEFVYERFLGQDSFREAMSFFSSLGGDDEGGVDIIYVASHGSMKSFGPSLRVTQNITNKFLIDQIRTNSPSDLHGIYLGCCYFATRYKREKILKESGKLSWCAGYSKEVDWEEPYFLDLLFLRRILHSKKLPTLAAMDAGEYIFEMLEKLADKLGFGISWRTEDGTIKSLPQ